MCPTGLIMMRGLLILCTFILTSCSAIEDKETLSFVIVLYRHGDRSPIHTFSTDPYQEDHWPQGFGQLTQTGMQQEYALGEYFRSRYIESGFMNSTYKRGEIYVRSTDFDRTIMSAESVLAAMYPPSGRQRWDDDILWQPIPIHVQPLTSDNVHGPVECQSLSEPDEEVKRTDAVLQYALRFNDTMELLRNTTGDTLENIWSIGYIYDALLCEMSDNLILPDWFTDELMAEFRYDIYPFIKSLAFKTVKQRRLRGGSLLHEYVAYLDKFMDSVKPNSSEVSPKMVMLSAHDSTVLRFLGALGAYNNLMVPYSTAILLEVVQLDPDSEHHIRVWLRNDTSEEPYLIPIPGCTELCTYEKLRTLFEPLLVEDFNTECQHHLYVLGLDFSNVVVVTLLSVGVGLLLLLILLGVVVCCCNRRWRRQRVRAYGRPGADGNFLEAVPMMNSAVGSDDEY